MNSLVIKNFGKITLILAAISLLWLGTFGLLHHMSEMKSESAISGGCLFNGQMDVCTMNFSEHIAFWQEMLTILPQNAELLGLLILIALMVVAISFWRNHLSLFFKLVASRWKLYLKQHPQIRLFNKLLEAFSRGILNSKIYAPAII